MQPINPSLQLPWNLLASLNKHNQVSYKQKLISCVFMSFHASLAPPLTSLLYFCVYVLLWQWQPLFGYVYDSMNYNNPEVG